jgi:hypothetical protein
MMAPMGPIYEAVPMARSSVIYAMPTVYAMESPAVRRVAVAPEARGERTCETSHARLDELERRVNDLHQELNGVKQNMIDQMKVLIEIRDKLK